MIDENLIKQWHTKNLKKPSDYYSGSQKKVWWICSKGHEWEAAILNRTYGSGCPYCTNRLVCKDNCLSTVFPELSHDWHPTKNHIGPNSVLFGSRKKFWWFCNKGHEWEAEVKSRTKGSGCPYCANRNGKAGPDNCLSVTHPHLVDEWHPKNAILPEYVTFGSAKKIWWLGKCGHEWESVIFTRTSEKSHCPFCAGKSQKKQRLLYQIVKELFNDFDVIYNHKHHGLRFTKSNRPMELDVYVPELSIAFEYQGEPHYLPIYGKPNLAKVQARDEEKRQACKDAAIRLIEINYEWNGEKNYVASKL